MEIREYTQNDITEITEIWNQVVKDGMAFPQKECLDEVSAKKFFSEQSFTGAAVDEKGRVVGMYILHPNNVGRCGHICNASFAVKNDFKGKGIGKSLVEHCLKKGKELGFKILQFNAVVKTNSPAVALYTKLGFVKLGEIPGGFLTKDNKYEDIILFYKIL